MIELILDRDAPVPLYYQIREYFRQAIAEGRLKPGDPLPSDNELAAKLGIGKMTVRQAMNDLVQEGLIYRYRGKGTFVAFPKFQHPLRRLTSFTEDITSRGMRPGSQILFFGHVPANNQVAANLHVPPGKSVLRIRRLRLADDNPVGIHDSYLPPNISISQEELEERGSLYRLLEERGVALAEAEETLEAVAAKKDEAALLGLPPGSPLLLVSRVVFSQSGEPIEYVRAIYRSDFYRYYIRLKR